MTRVIRILARIVFPGLVCFCIGVWWTIDGLSNGEMEELIGGLTWKGPLMIMLGLGLAVLGYRMLKSQD
jgi:hypothetical protein